MQCTALPEIWKRIILSEVHGNPSTGSSSTMVPSTVLRWWTSIGGDLAVPLNDVTEDPYTSSTPPSPLGLCIWTIRRESAINLQQVSDVYENTTTTRTWKQRRAMSISTLQTHKADSHVWRKFLSDGETPQKLSTTYSGRSGFRSTQGIQGTTAYRYNAFIMSFMANPMIYRGHYKFPYISLYLDHPPALPVAWAACDDASISIRKSMCQSGRRKHKPQFTRTFSCAYACAYAYACVTRENQPIRCSLSRNVEYSVVWMDCLFQTAMSLENLTNRSGITVVKRST